MKRECDCRNGGVSRSCRICHCGLWVTLHDVRCHVVDSGYRVTTDGRFICQVCWESREQRDAVPAAVRNAVIERDGYHCTLCGRSVRDRRPGETYAPDLIQLDHVHEWAAGGEHTVENLRVTCAECNLSRPKPARTRGRRLVPSVVPSNPVLEAQMLDSMRAAILADRERRAQIPDDISELDGGQG